MTLYALTFGKTTSELTTQNDAAQDLAKSPPTFNNDSLLQSYPRAATGVLAMAASLALGSFLFRGSASQQAQAASVAAPPPQARWLDITKPYQLYTLDVPELSKLPRSYEARRQATGVGRQDVMTLGNFAAGTQWLRLNIRRFGQDGTVDPGFFVDIARRAADAGLAVSHAGVPTQVASRFGAMDFASVVLERTTTNLACLSFRLAETGPGLAITGLFCPAPGKTAEPGHIVCLLDRFSLAGGGEDAALRQIFVNAELKRERYCAGSKYTDFAPPKPVQAPSPPAFPDKPTRKRQ